MEEFPAPSLNLKKNRSFGRLVYETYYFYLGARNPLFRGKLFACLSCSLDKLAVNISKLQTAVQEVQGKINTEAWVQLISAFQDVSRQLRQASAFISCLTAQDVKDVEAQRLNAEVQKFRAELSSIMDCAAEAMLKVDQAEWKLS